MSAKARSEHFLLKIDRLIDWEPLAALMQPPHGAAHAAPAQPVVKMLLLARWYCMSETALLEACQDRVSFRRFLDLPLTDYGGDDALRDAYRRQTLLAPMESQELVQAIEAQLLAAGLSIRPGKWAEAVVQPLPNAPAETQAGLAETAIFGAGELKALAKRGKGRAGRGKQRSVADAFAADADAPELPPPPALEGGAVRASVRWPWGDTTPIDPALIVGRDPAACAQAARLAAFPHVSRKHAELTACPVGVWVRDLRSHNGTFVNEEKLSKGNAFLVDADAQLRFGPYCIVQLKLDA